MAIALSSAMTQLQRAQLLQQQGRVGEAWAILSPLRAAIDDNGQALRLYALVAQPAGRLDEAIAALQRIVEVEREPPEILGALADLLSKAGRHDEALHHWDSLVARHPDIADAHLNRAVTAANAGKPELAFEAADAGLSRFPGHARLTATKAMALKNLGRIEESIALFEIAVRADPDRALTRHNQAVALRAGCRFDEACEAYAAAARLGMKGAQFLANWAASAVEAGHVEEAVRLYEAALAEEPAHGESCKALTRLQIEYLGADDAFAHYESAAKTRGFAPEVCLVWIDALMRHNRLEQAASVTSQALAHSPDHAMLRTLEAFLKGMTEDPEPWLDKLEHEAAHGPGDAYLTDSIQFLSIRARRWDRAAILLQDQLARDPDNQVVWAKLSIVWRMLGDPREHWLCDYDNLVMVTEVPSPDGLLSPAEYAKAVATALDPLHQSLYAPGDQTLRGGTQTSGELFAHPQREIQDFRKAILLAATDMVAALPADTDHPFLRRKSRRLDIAGSWSVRLRSGGHHVSHVHQEGWMSSAYYARLPDADDAADERHAGWIQFGVPPENFDLQLPPRRIVEPQPGRLVLFPSYLWHGTVPFKSGNRLTAAFDYLPA
jgi:tetratricopeptide (TPR) repeat protein